MRNPEAILQDACAAMTAGDAEACEAALTAFRTAISASPLDETGRSACERQLVHLRGLAQAAVEGLDGARL